jgi:hypothetical protein
MPGLLNFAFRQTSIFLFHATDKSTLAAPLLDKLSQLAQSLARGRAFEERVDLTLDLVYHEQRESDAFSRCMAVQHPCAEVAKYRDKNQESTTCEVLFNHSPGEGKLSPQLSSDQIREYGEQLLRFLQKADAKDSVVHVLRHSTLGIVK